MYTTGVNASMNIINIIEFILSENQNRCNFTAICKFLYTLCPLNRLLNPKILKLLKI